MTSMEESARKGLELLELNGSDATFQKKCTDDRRSPYYTGRRIEVSGYDTSLPSDDIEMRLTKHFSSCGKVRHVFVMDGPPKSFAHILLGEGALDKALELSGCDMDGWNIVVDHVFPPPDLQRKHRPTLGSLPKRAKMKALSSSEEEERRRLGSIKRRQSSSLLFLT